MSVRYEVRNVELRNTAKYNEQPTCYLDQFTVVPLDGSLTKSMDVAEMDL